jgi:hypothetical protein
MTNVMIAAVLQNPMQRNGYQKVMLERKAGVGVGVTMMTLLLLVVCLKLLERT